MKRIISGFLIFTLFISALHSAPRIFTVPQNGNETEGFIYTPEKLTYKNRPIKFYNQEIRNNFLFKPDFSFFLFPKTFTVTDDAPGKGFHIDNENKAGKTNYYVYDFKTNMIQLRLMDPVFQASEVIAENLILPFLIVPMIITIAGIVLWTLNHH